MRDPVEVRGGIAAGGARASYAPRSSRPGALALLLLFAGLLLSPPSRAQVIAGDDPVQVLTLTAGTLAGLTNTVVTVIYGVRNEAFEEGWVISSFVSGAICGAFAVGLTVEASDSSDANLMWPALGYYVVALGPMLWAIRGALSEVDPGAPFDPPGTEVGPRPASVLLAPTLDPFAARRAPAGAETGLLVGLPPLRF